MKVRIIKNFDPAHYNVGDEIEIDPKSPLLTNGLVESIEPVVEVKTKKVKK